MVSVIASLGVATSCGPKFETQLERDLFNAMCGEGVYTEHIDKITKAEIVGPSVIYRDQWQSYDIQFEIEKSQEYSSSICYAVLDEDTFVSTQVLATGNVLIGSDSNQITVVNAFELTGTADCSNTRSRFKQYTPFGQSKNYTFRSGSRECETELFVKVVSYPGGDGKIFVTKIGGCCYTSF